MNKFVLIAIIILYGFVDPIISHYVIATSGLNLRTEPSINADVIIKIEYGEKVILVDEPALVDQINNLNGKWIKIEYAGKEGYVFDPYIITSNGKFHTPKINNDYALLNPICSCVENYQYEPSLHWYGIFQAQDNTFLTKEVYFSYHRQKATIGEEVCIDVNGDSKPLFIVGSKTKISSHKGKVKKFYSSLEFDDQDPMNKLFYYEQDINELILCYENRDIDLSESEKYLFPRSVVWRGDLNNDNIEDYIIEYGSKSSKLILILSKKTKSEVEFIKVAEYHHGYCC